MHHFCTYFDQKYLARALVLHRSLVEHTGTDFVLWALCLDETAYELVDGLSLATFRPVRLADLEAAAPEVAATKSTRSRVEYYFTLTPALPHHLLATHPEIDVISYLDADLRFYADPTLVLDHMALGSVIIIPHGFPQRLKRLEIHGRYNVGMVSFRRDGDGLACLERWRARCIEWCYDRVEDGRFADQAYLDDWPAVHPGVVVVDVPGIGLGPWNFMRHRIKVSGNRATVDGRPLVFYHFHAFKGITTRIFDDGLLNYGRMPRRVRSFLYAGYIRDLDVALRTVASQRLATAESGRTSPPNLRSVLALAKGRRLLVRIGARVLG